jgi:hypothetical protein
MSADPRVRPLPMTAVDGASKSLARGDRSRGSPRRGWTKAPAVLLVVVMLGLVGCSGEASEEQVVAEQLCKEVNALAAVGADADTVLYPAMVLSQDAMNRGLDQEIFEAEVMKRCGPALEAAIAADEARWDEARAVADRLVVTVERCDDDGFSGTVTNTSDRTVTSAWIELIVLAEGGAGAFEVEGISIGSVYDPNAIPALGPGESAPWSMTLEEYQRSDWMGNPLGPVAACEVGFANVGGWE